MHEFAEWRGFDLRKRREKIRKAFNREKVSSPEDIPIIINTPCYFGFGNKPLPEDYWKKPECMVNYQADNFELHLGKVKDDTIPYFMPWFGTGVLASAFGCKVKDARGNGDDPGIAGTCIDTVSDAAKLKLPDPYKDGLMPRVLEFIDYARAKGDLPVGLTDMNSPLCTVAQMCGYDRLFIWMYEEPSAVHHIFEIVTEAFIEWVKTQKKHIGEPLNRSNGLQGVWSPEPVGVWVSDDDLVSLGPDLYKEFVVPYYSRIFKEFGGGSVHFCGNGFHQGKNLLAIDNIKVVNNSPLWNFNGFGKLIKSLDSRVTIQIQDIAPVEPELYYSNIFHCIDDLRGVMLATFVLDNIAMSEGGGSEYVDWNTLDTANRIVEAVKECVRKKLDGEPLL